MWFFLILFHLDVWKCEGGWSSWEEGRACLEWWHLKIASWEALRSLAMDSIYSYANRREVCQVGFRKAAPATSKDDLLWGHQAVMCHFSIFLQLFSKIILSQKATMSSEDRGTRAHQYWIPSVRSLLISWKNILLLLLQKGVLGYESYWQRKYI